MKTGDQVRVRRLGAQTWVPATVDLASQNQRSLALSADEGLVSIRGFTLNRETGRMVLLLVKPPFAQFYYQDVVTKVLWEVQDAQDQ